MAPRKPDSQGMTRSTNPGSGGPRITAVLGPTNTGKTHLAIERMLDYPSGMIGFPLRLLARENYDRVVRLAGRRRVALVTGEEKIVPPNPSYCLCTVESIPLDRKVEFLAVDEIQLAADPERGHVFTDRLLHARGEAETMFVGAETVRRILKRLVPEAEFIGRPRLSRLSYAGPKKLSRLPPRSAVVGFSANDVYALAETMRSQRGGAAVVLGALSPRTRNAQVAMYQAGEVDYLVATDAIGMGLNMDIGHVAFSGLVKFDGRGQRRLSPPEVAQIAGRAGRYLNDGSFGTTAGLGPLDGDLVEAVENHRFESLKTVFWRNTALDFSSPAFLLRSLDAPPQSPVLARAREADDQRTLAALVGQPEVARVATGGAALRLLWEVCRIPDFRKIMSDVHARLLARIYLQLISESGHVDGGWAAEETDRIDRTDGDIDTLVGRIDHIRTWTYISHRPDWLDGGTDWQARTREIEDRLSDALHQRLTQRFVDRRAAVLVKRMRGGADLVGAVAKDGGVLVEGQQVGRLDGFRFVVDGAESDEEARAIRSAVRRALRGEIAARLDRFEADPDRAFKLDGEGSVAWHRAPVGRLVKGPQPFAPRVEPLASELLEPAMRERLRARLEAWLAAHLDRQLPALAAARDADLSGPARGILYQLAEGLGALSRRAVEGLVDGLGPGERKALAGLGVRLGRDSVYLAPLMRPRAVRLRALLWSVHRQVTPPALDPEATVVPAADDAPADFYTACGYRRTGALAIRMDRAEKLAAEARKLARQGPFVATPKLAAAAGCGLSELPALLAGLGFRRREDESGVSFTAGQRARRPQGKRPQGKRPQGKRPQGKRSPHKAPATNPCSPFSVLRDLVPPK